MSVNESELEPRELSPELVLVDPSLRELALRLPHVPSIAAAAEIVPLGVPLRPRPESRPAPVRKRRFVRPAATAAAAIAVTTALSYGLLRLQEPSPQPAPAPTAAAPSRDLVWAAVRGARRYHVLVLAGATVVLDTVTTTPHVRLILEPGAYRWWVWPVDAHGTQAAPIVESDLVVTSRREA